jgi:cytochrome c-type biogenesis protein CcmE
MKPRHKKLTIIVAGVAALGIASMLVLNAFQSNLVFFFSPSQVVAKEAPIGKSFRIGGLVEEGSVKREDSSTTVRFSVTDTMHRLFQLYIQVFFQIYLGKVKVSLLKEKYLQLVFLKQMKC